MDPKLFAPLLALSVCGPAMAQRSGFGAGLIIGEPTGFSVKAYLSDDKAIAGALAWSLGGHEAFRIHGDYLFHKDDVISVSKGNLPLYFGPGVRIRFLNDEGHYYNGDYHDTDSSVDLGIRFPVGLCYQFDDAPVDVFLELVPGIGVIPSTYFDFDFGLGARYWF